VQTLVIALNTFKEAVRNKVFYTLIFFAFVFTVFSISLSTMVLGDMVKVIIDMGLANIEIFGALIAIFVGIFLVYKELERRTIYTIITRPISRWQFILGKYLGLVLTLIVEIFIMTSIFFAIIIFFNDAPEKIPALMLAIWLIFIKLLLITAVAVFFSSISTPILSGMFTLAFYVIGSISGHLMSLIEQNTAPMFATFIRMLAFLLPDFRFLDVKGMVYYEHEITASKIFLATSYGLLYTVIILALAMLIFDRKDMK